jgi:hypothetical protein
LPTPDFLPLAGAVAWAAVWGNVVVIPFFQKREKLHQEYWANGTIDAALSFVESEKIIPIIADMVDKAKENTPAKRKSDTVQLLQSVRFLPDLEKLDVEMAKLKSLKDQFACLEVISTKVWKKGIAHIVFTLALPLANQSPKFLEWILAGVGVFWAGTFVLMLAGLFSFHKKMNTFLETLKANRAGFENE